jgi:hypothetical protein
MIFPGKHISQEKALLTVGAELLKNLDKPKTVSAIWEDIRQPAPGTHGDVANLSYDWFILALDLLFIFDAIEIHEGLLKRRIS